MLQSMGLQRVRCDLATKQQQKIVKVIKNHETYEKNLIWKMERKNSSIRTT